MSMATHASVEGPSVRQILLHSCRGVLTVQSGRRQMFPAALILTQVVRLSFASWTAQRVAPATGGPPPSSVTVFDARLPRSGSAAHPMPVRARTTARRSRASPAIWRADDQDDSRGSDQPARALWADDFGVYVTSNGGARWDVLGGNLPSVAVMDFIVRPRTACSSSRRTAAGCGRST